MSDYSDQEIDLRPYVEAVLGKWYWIVGLALLAGILAFAATTLFVSPVYEATALISITEPRQRVQFDPRIVTVEENQPLRAYPEIAISDELLSTLRNETPVATSFNLQQLRSMLKASPGSDPSLLKLTAKNTDPETASALANSWAELFVAWANRTYGDSGEEQLLFFEQRLEDAAADLQATEDELIAYQALNRSKILENELLALQQTHADLLAKEEGIELLSRDIESILAASENGQSVGSDQFTALILKLRAFGGPASEGSAAPPWQLQINTDSGTAELENDSESQILNLQNALAIQAGQTRAAVAEIEPQILAVQKEKQEADAKESLMQRNVDLAKDTHTALARTVEEKRITSQDTNTGVSLASRSSVPAYPVGPRRSFNSLAAAVAAALLAVLIIILTAWWRPQ